MLFFCQRAATFYETLVAPFDFAIAKPVDELEAEREFIRANAKQYYDYNFEVYNQNYVLQEIFVELAGKEIDANNKKEVQYV